MFCFPLHKWLGQPESVRLGIPVLLRSPPRAYNLRFSNHPQRKSHAILSIPRRAARSGAIICLHRSEPVKRCHRPAFMQQLGRKRQLCRSQIACGRQPEKRCRAALCRFEHRNLAKSRQRSGGVGAKARCCGGGFKPVLRPKRAARGGGIGGGGGRSRVSL